MSLRTLPLFLALSAGAVLAAAAPRPSGRPGLETPVLRALPETVRISGLVVRLDLGKSEIAIRDHHAVRRTFKVEGWARKALQNMTLGDEVLLTCRPHDSGLTVIHIEVVLI